MKRIWLKALLVGLSISTLGFADDKAAPASKEADKSAEKGAAVPQYDLREEVAVGNQVRHRLDLTIKGSVKADDKEVPLAGKARLDFHERVLTVGEDGLSARVVRHYGYAGARFRVGTGDDSRLLRGEQRLAVGERDGTALKLWAPAGPLTGEERELVEDVLDVTRLPHLLPVAPVKVGESWDIAADVAVAMFNLDSYISSQLKGTLLKVTGERAEISITGEVSGMSLAAEVKSKVVADITVDLPTKRIVSMEWKQEDGRATSPVAPAGNYDVQISLTRSVEKSEKLTDELVKDKALERREGSMLLVFEDSKKRFRFLHDRSWHLTVNRPEAVVFRRMDGNDFIAQLNVIGVGGKESGKLTKEEFQKAVEQAGGWKIEQITANSELPTDGSFSLQTLSALGSTGETKVLQKHYLATGKDGRQVAFTFVLEPNLEGKLGTGDMSLVGTVEFPALDAAAKPADTRK